MKECPLCLSLTPESVEICSKCGCSFSDDNRKTIPMSSVDDTHETKLLTSEIITNEQWEKVKDIFIAIQELPYVEREKFLEKAAAGDSVIISEVKNLLSSYKEEDDFLEDKAMVEATDLFEKKHQLNKDLSDKLVNGSIFGNHYRILGLLGKGGMGEVFLAQDTRLDRKVALKILPETFANNSARMKRFVQEARSVSALNHPNILTIYEISEAEDIHFMATEYVEGKTLHQLLKREKLEFNSALDLAIQIASALAAAHEEGIVHRDIKPDNLMIRKDGIVKVLDFGLAKLTVKDSEDDINKEKITREMVMTMPGMILGTPQYMSPEQARGRNIDLRTDIFSFGVVFYEMITSHPPFTGDNSMDIIGSILRDEPPPLGKYIKNVPLELEQIVNKTLRKDSAQRYQNIKDLLINLEDLKDELRFKAKLSYNTNESRVKNFVQNTESLIYSSRFNLLPLVVFLFASTIIGASVWWYFLGGTNKTTVILPNTLKTVEIANWSSPSREYYSVATFSPNGNMIAFNSTKAGKKGIWVKQKNIGEGVQVVEDEFDNANPIWSPDGNEIAFYSNRGGKSGIWRIPVLGGSPKPIATLDYYSILRHWSKSGKIYYETNRNLYAVDIGSGETSQITDLDVDKLKITQVDISPDESKIAYINQEGDLWKIWVKPVGNSEAQQVFSGKNRINSLVWNSDSKTIFYNAQKDGVFQIFELDLERKVSPVQLTFMERDSEVQDISPDGTDILIGSSTENSDLWQVNSENLEESVIVADVDSELWADVSPDSSEIVYQSIMNLSSGNNILIGAIETANLSDGSEQEQLNEEGFLPKWSPDGKKVAFMRMDKEVEIWTIKKSGSDLAKVASGEIFSADYTIAPYNTFETNDFSWSPKSDVIAYSARKDELINIFLVSADGTSNRILTDNKDKELLIYCPIWSSDGTKLAYSTKTNRREPNAKIINHFWIYDFETKENQKIFETDEPARLIGWSETEKELLVATTKNQFLNMPQKVNVYNIGIEDSSKKLANKFEETYYQNIRLSPDRKTLAFVSRSTDNDEVWISAVGGQTRRLTKNNDPWMYYSSLTWSPDNKNLIFCKQKRYSLLSMLVKSDIEENVNEKQNN